jgi:hypothetical protein
MVASRFTDVTKFTAVGAGTGSFVVAGAVTGYQTPATANAVTATSYSYRAESADLTQWENGAGVYTSSNVTLTRTPSANSAGGSSAINFTLAPQVGLVQLSADIMRGYYFSANLSAAQLTSAAGVFIKVGCNTVTFDPQGWYDNVNFRFTPLFSGKYRVAGAVQAQANSSIGELDVEIQKNSSTYVRAVYLLGGTITVQTNKTEAIIDFNGTTDFVELHALVAGSTTINFLGGTAPIRTIFEAHYIGQ